jgi:addiction module HigA family antidote
MRLKGNSLGKKRKRLPVSRRRPVHPGAILLLDFMQPLELSSYRLAKELGVSIPTVHEIVRRRRAVTVEMALRFARYFGTSAEFWQGLQAAYDLVLERRRIGSGALRSIEPISRQARAKVSIGTK